MTFRLFVCVLAVTVVGAVLDGSKVYKQSHTRLKTSSKAHHMELPSSVLSQFKANAHGDVHIPLALETVLARSRRDGETCGFDASIELEISPVS